MVGYDKNWKSLTSWHSVLEVTDPQTSTSGSTVCFLVILVRNTSVVKED